MWKVNTAHISLSFRIDHCARTAQIWRSKRKVERATRRTTHHRTRQEKLPFLDESWLCRCIAKEHQRLDWCRDPRRYAADRRSETIDHAFAWLCLLKTSTSSARNFWTMRTAHALTCGIHFMMGAASNAGLFPNSKLQKLKLMSKYCWTDVQSHQRAYAEWEYWPAVPLAKDKIGRGCMAWGGQQLEAAGLVRNLTSLDGLKSLRESSVFLMRLPSRRNPGNTCWNSRGIRLGSCSFGSDCFKHKL